MQQIFDQVSLKEDASSIWFRKRRFKFQSRKHLSEVDTSFLGSCLPRCNAREYLHLFFSLLLSFQAPVKCPAAIRSVFLDRLLREKKENKPSLLQCLSPSTNTQNLFYLHEFFSFFYLRLDPFFFPSPRAVYSTS